MNKKLKKNQWPEVIKRQGRFYRKVFFPTTNFGLFIFDNSTDVKGEERKRLGVLSFYEKEDGSLFWKRSYEMVPRHITCPKCKNRFQHQMKLYKYPFLSIAPETAEELVNTIVEGFEAIGATQVADIKKKTQQRKQEEQDLKDSGLI